MRNKNIPTDRHGEVYYGPKTWTGIIDEMKNWPEYSDEEYLAELKKMREHLASHGHPRLAATFYRTFLNR